VTRLQARLSTVRLPAEKRENFSSPHRPARTLAPTSRPHTQWVLGFFTGVKRSGRDAEHSPPTNAEVKNERNDTSALPACHHDVERDKLTLDSI
jgi:hypothetical protein